MTRWEPGVRQESFIQGVKIANLVRKKVPLLILSFREVFRSVLQEDPARQRTRARFREKVLQGFSGFSRRH